MKSSVVIALVVVVTFIGVANALECWTCTSRFGNHFCDDPFNETEAMDNPANITKMNCDDWAKQNAPKRFNQSIGEVATTCYKQYSYHSGIRQGKKVIVGHITRRSCSFTKPDDAGCWSKGAAQGGAKICVCTGDNCNTASHVISATSTLLLFISAAILA